MKQNFELLATFDWNLAFLCVIRNGWVILVESYVFMKKGNQLLHLNYTLEGADCYKKSEFLVYAWAKEIKDIIV